MVRLIAVSEDLDAEAATPSRAYGWAMLLFSIPVAVVGTTFLINAARWWSYATGAIALVGAAMLVYFGSKVVRGWESSP